jgi:flagellar basal-body rod protein FlgC
MINAIKIALTGLNAATKKLDTIASNVANLTTSGSLKVPETPPYKALDTAQQTINDSFGNGQGVQTNIIEKTRPFTPGFDPSSPFADENGIIGLPNVNLAEEAVNLTIAKTNFKANAAVIKVAAEMEEELQRLFDKEV